MFEDELQRRLRLIFGVSKVRYDLPGESQEQECLFVNITDSRARVSNNSERARVNGEIVIFANADKMPFGFFSKKINQADPRLTKDLFFHNMDQNERRYQNIVERRCEFVFLYHGDYNPAKGEITSIEFA